MSMDTFHVFGRVVGAQEPYVTVSLSGMDFDGKIYGTYGNDEEISFRSQQLTELRDDNLVMSQSEMESANSGLVNALDLLGEGLSPGSGGGGPPEHSQAVEQLTDESMRALFKATVRSARESQ